MKFPKHYGYSFYNFDKNIIYNLGNLKDVQKPPIRLSLAAHFPVRQTII